MAHHPYVVALLVFVSMIFVDLAWSLYIRSLATDKILKAAVFSSLIMLCGAFSTISYIENRWMLIPAVTGGFIGTLLCKRVEKLFERKSKA